MLSKINQFVKTHQNDIILVIGVILISLLSFATGYIVAKKQENESMRKENEEIKMKRNNDQLFIFLSL